MNSLQSCNVVILVKSTLRLINNVLDRQIIRMMTTQLHRAVTISACTATVQKSAKSGHKFCRSRICQQHGRMRDWV